MRLSHKVILVKPSLAFSVLTDQIIATAAATSVLLLLVFVAASSSPSFLCQIQLQSYFSG